MFLRHFPDFFVLNREHHPSVQVFAKERVVSLQLTVFGGNAAQSGLRCKGRERFALKGVLTRMITVQGFHWKDPLVASVVVYFCGFVSIFVF